MVKMTNNTYFMIYFLVELNLRNIKFCTAKCAKKDLFRTLLIFVHSCCAKINGAEKLVGLRNLFMIPFNIRQQIAAAISSLRINCSSYFQSQNS